MDSEIVPDSHRHTEPIPEKLPVTNDLSTKCTVNKDESVMPGQGSADAPLVRMSNLRWFSVCIGLYLTAFLYGLDSTIAADVQGPILASLGDLNMLPWVGTGFLLGSVATVSLFGSLYTKIEVKWLYLASIVAFEVEWHNRLGKLESDPHRTRVGASSVPSLRNRCGFEFTYLEPERIRF